MSMSPTPQKTFAGVDGKRVDGGDYHDFFVGVDAAFIFQFLELFYQLGADVELLDFISAYGPCNAGGFSPFPKRYPCTSMSSL